MALVFPGEEHLKRGERMRGVCLPGRCCRGRDIGNRFVLRRPDLPCPVSPPGRGYALDVAGSARTTIRVGDRVRAPGRDGGKKVQATVVGFFDPPTPSRLEQGGRERFVCVC